MNSLNILLMVADNQRPDTIAALGNSHIKTPNLDRLVESGTSFQNAYYMGSTTGATCLPSRTMLMTGRSLYHIPNEQMCEEAEAANPITGIPCLPEVLKLAGYRSLRTGKHGNYPRFAAQHFDKNIVVARSVNGSERHANNAIEFLHNPNRDKPFFLYVAFGAPNDPHVGPGTAPAEYMDMYPVGSVPAPPNFLPVHPFDNGEMIIRDELLAPWPRTEEVIERHLSGYYSVITYMDAQIGRILETLAATGLDKSTIVIFTSDTGTAIGSHGLMGMQNLYEHSIGVPLIISGPEIPATHSSYDLVYLHDLFPTICDLAGLPVPTNMDGNGLFDRTKRGTLGAAYRNVQRAIRDERWKLICYPHIGEYQLFDLTSDPHETNNLITLQECEGKKNELLQALHAWQVEFDDPYLAGGTDAYAGNAP